MGVMAIILIIIILKTSLQVIRGSSWRREPLKSISESYCFQWKIKPTQDCCDGAARLVREMWRFFIWQPRRDTSLPLSLVLGPQRSRAFRLLLSIPLVPREKDTISHRSSPSNGLKSPLFCQYSSSFQYFFHIDNHTKQPLQSSRK